MRSLFASAVETRVSPSWVWHIAYGLGMLLRGDWNGWSAGSADGHAKSTSKAPAIPSCKPGWATLRTWHCGNMACLTVGGQMG